MSDVRLTAMVEARAASLLWRYDRTLVRRGEIVHGITSWIVLYQELSRSLGNAMYMDEIDGRLFTGIDGVTRRELDLGWLESVLSGMEGEHLFRKGVLEAVEAHAPLSVTGPELNAVARRAFNDKHPLNDVRVTLGNEADKGTTTHPVATVRWSNHRGVKYIWFSDTIQNSWRTTWPVIEAAIVLSEL